VGKDGGHRGAGVIRDGITFDCKESGETTVQASGTMGEENNGVSRDGMGIDADIAAPRTYPQRKQLKKQTASMTTDPPGIRPSPSP